MAPLSSSEARCKGCGRRIVWARHAISGKAMPFDAEPHTHGTWDLREGFAGADAIAVHDPHADARYVPHHATCPQVDQFRRKLALKNTHPDRGGDPEAFQQVQQARRVLESRSS